MKTTYTLLLVAAGILTTLAGTSAPNPLYLIRSNLNMVAADGSTTLLDGDLTQYDPGYSDSLDALDARKMTNPGENIGMSRDGQVLSVERRQTIINTDTIFYKIWNLRAVRSYQLQFVATNLYQPGLLAFVKDAYLNINTPVDLEDTTVLDFNIDANPASYATNRFTLIFMTPVGGTLPLSLLSMKAVEIDNSVTVQWQTGVESSVKYYTVQRSTDDRNFTTIGEAGIKNMPSNTYSFTDDNPKTGYNYYRIAITSLDGAVSYSDIALVYTGSSNRILKIYPNPVNGNIIHLQLPNQPAGTYTARLINTQGRVVLTRQIQHAAAATENIEVNISLPRGIYHLELTDPGGFKNTISLYY